MSNATAAQVREWAAENGFETKAGPGRLPKAVIEAFNEGRKKSERYAGPQPTKVVVSAKPAKGRTKRKTATTDEIRAFAVANGMSKPGQRGRFSQEILRAFVLGLDAE